MRLNGTAVIKFVVGGVVYRKKRCPGLYRRHCCRSKGVSISQRIDGGWCDARRWRRRTSVGFRGASSPGLGVKCSPCKEKARIKRRPKSRSLPGLHFNTQSTAFLHQDNQPIECYIDASASQSICLVLAYYFSTFCPGASGHPPLWLQRITTSRVGHCKSQLYSVHCMCDRPPQIINRTCPPGANFQGNPLHLPTNRFKTGPSCLHRLQDYHTCLCSDLSSKTTRHIHKHRLTQPSLVQSSPVPPPLALDLDSNTTDTTDTLISDPSLCCALHRITCKPVGS